MSVTTLAGTIWQFNDTVDFSQFTSSFVPYIYRSSTTRTNYFNLYTYERAYRGCFHNAYAGYTGQYFGLAFSTAGLAVSHWSNSTGSSHTNSELKHEYVDRVSCAIIEFLSNTTDGTVIGLDDPVMIAWFEANAKQISGIFDLSTLGLSDGSHTITVKAQTSEGEVSEESNSVPYNVYNITDLTNTTWRVSADSFKYGNTLIFSGTVSYDDYVLTSTAQRTKHDSTTESRTYFSYADATNSNPIYPLFRVSKGKCQVCPTSGGTYIDIPYFDVHIDGESARSSSYAYMTDDGFIRWFKVNATKQ
jgi:hypothetical protein